MKKKCKHHKDKKLGYIAWHEWAEQMTKDGHKQTQCPDCKHYFFACEMGVKPKGMEYGS
jgi:hypothetical protein